MIQLLQPLNNNTIPAIQLNYYDNLIICTAHSIHLHCKEWLVTILLKDKHVLLNFSNKDNSYFIALYHKRLLVLYNDNASKNKDVFIANIFTTNTTIIGNLTLTINTEECTIRYKQIILFTCTKEILQLQQYKITLQHKLNVDFDGYQISNTLDQLYFYLPTCSYHVNCKAIICNTYYYHYTITNEYVVIRFIKSNNIYVCTFVKYYNVYVLQQVCNLQYNYRNVPHYNIQNSINNLIKQQSNIIEDLKQLI